MGVYAPLDSEARKIFTDEYLVAKDFKRFKDTLDTDPDSQKPFLGFLEGFSTVPSNNLAQCAEVAQSLHLLSHSVNIIVEPPRRAKLNFAFCI